MLYLVQFAIILSISFLGEICHALVPLPVPSSIWGMVILLLGLTTGIIPLHMVQKAANFLIAIMPIMFIPLASGLIESWSAIRANLAAYLILIVVSTFFVMIVSGFAVQKSIEAKGGESDE